MNWQTRHQLCQFLPVLQHRHIVYTFFVFAFVFVFVLLVCVSDFRNFCAIISDRRDCCNHFTTNIEWKSHAVNDSACNCVQPWHPHAVACCHTATPPCRHVAMPPRQRTVRQLGSLAVWQPVSCLWSIIIMKFCSANDHL